MAKKLKIWLNNKLNKRLRCTVVTKFYHVFITELVLTFKSKSLPWGGMDIFCNHTLLNNSIVITIGNGIFH